MENDIYKKRDDAWEELKQLIGTNKTINLTRALFDAWQEDRKNSFPNIEVGRYEKGKPVYFTSTLEDFPSMGFGSEIEAHFANTLFLLYKSSGKEFKRETFTATFQMVLTMFDIKSGWRF